MKLLIFCPFYPPHIGGLETHALEFNRHIAPSVKSILVFTPQLPESAPVRETEGNITILRFPAFEPIHNYPVPKFWNTDFWRQWHALSDDKYDIVISRTRFFFSSLMALCYSYRKNVRLLHIEHGSDFAQFNGQIKTALGKIYDWIFGRLVLRYADGIVANSQASARFVSRLSSRLDISVIYRGTNIEAIEKCAPRQDLIEQYSDKNIIAFIGRLIDGKGVHDLILALSLLQRNDIVTFIIGGGAEESRLKKMVEEHNLSNQVIFFGNLPFEKAISILKTAHIVVNPSYTEGLPTSVAEAALCQKAIIATNVGGTSEVISGNNDGFLIPPRQPKVIAEKISLLLDTPGLQTSISQAAFSKVQSKFSWHHATDQYLEIFSALHKK
ncbi:MAG: glycosyltransferase family 4 protein [Candidatus Moraniibacteriota bacterium]